MIRLPNHITISGDTIAKLVEYQALIDAKLTFTEKSIEAKRLFPARNTINNSTFKHIKEKLTDMCSGAKRCAYCEDSMADEVEHIYPKDLYPGKCFSWDNYIYACGPCNGPKNNKFAIFRHDNSTFMEVNPPKGQPAIEPPSGDSALIDPRIEDAMEFCMLDLQGTFKFVIIAQKGTKEYQRADYTFNTVLRLNDQREVLRVARERAFENYKARLYEYDSEKLKGIAKTKLDKMIEGIQRESHPTVWREMQRYHRKGLLVKFNNNLNELFLRNPEALTW